MNTISQVSAFIENRPGMLREILGILSEEGINLRALNVAENEDYGILRIIPDNIEKTMKVLKANEYLVSEIQGIRTNIDGMLCLLKDKLPPKDIDWLVNICNDVFSGKRFDDALFNDVIEHFVQKNIEK